MRAYELMEDEEQQYKLFVDLDGVLANFEKGVLDVTGFPINKQKSNSQMWKALYQHGNFYAELDMMADAMVLWNYVKKYNPTILTGIPRGNWAPPQKEAWVAKHLGSSVPVITGMARDKYNYAAENHILIDDTKRNIDEWNRAKGIGIHHIGAKSSIEQLQDLGL